MTLDRMVVSARAARPDRFSLSDRVESFRLTDPSNGRVAWTALDLGTAIVSEVETTGHVVSAAAEQGLCLLAPTDGEITVETGGTTVAARAGGALLLGPGSRTSTARALHGARLRGLGIVIKTEPHWHGRPAIEIAHLSRLPAARALVGFGRYALEDAGQPESRFNGTRLRRAAEALIQDAARDLVDAVEPLTLREANRTVRHVRAAAAYMRAHSDDPLTVRQIAAVVGVGERALQAAFRAQLDTTPRALLTEIRFDRARARLLAAGPEATVSDLALASGFAHFGRFAEAYRRRYGERPSQTLRRATGLPG